MSNQSCVAVMTGGNLLAQGFLRPARSRLCWFLDAGNDETLRTLNWPASKKRQDTKSREVGHRLSSERYGDLMPAPNSMIAVRLAGFDLRVWTYGMPAECNGHFGGCSERINARSAR
jgi:hypothetical protein